MALPDAAELVCGLAQQLKPHITDNSAIVGIHSGGVWVARKLHEQLGRDVPLGALDISFYRDDFSHTGLHPRVRPSSIPFDVEGRDIVLVDDVLYTGRTVRAAMNELFDYGRPASIKLAVLLDRGGREFPIEAQWVGTTLPLARGQNIQVTLDPEGNLQLTLHEKRPPAQAGEQ